MAESGDYTPSFTRNRSNNRGKRTYSKGPGNQDPPAPKTETVASETSTNTPPPVKKPVYRNKQHGKSHSAPQSKQTTSSLLIQPSRSLFPIFCSNIGTARLASIIFRLLTSRDAKLQQSITLLQCEYVTTMAFLNRLVILGTDLGYTLGIDGASRLKECAKGIWLPQLLAKYIESLGSYTLASGVTVVPWVSDYETMFPNGNSPVMRGPASILEDAGRVVPLSPWAIDTEWIINWNMSMTRASRQGLKFQQISTTVTEGRAEMVCSYCEQGDQGAIFTVPYAPQTISTAEAQLGAAYQFRNIAETEDWPGGVSELVYPACSGVRFEADMFLTNLALQTILNKTE